MFSPSIHVNSIAAEIVKSLHALQDRKTAAIRSLRREFSSRLAQALPREVIEVALVLLRKPSLDRRFVAYELVCHNRNALRSLRAKDLEQLGDGIDHWAAVDSFACYLAGPAWREKQVPDSLIHRWAKSNDFWWRRAALVSTVPLNNKARGGRGDAPRTVAVCQMLTDDHEDMVVKALSWALRELSKRDLAAARTFLKKNADLLHARVTREVRNKLKTGLKNPRRK